MHMDNYTIYHLHSDLSNGVTNIDSVTKFHEYVDMARKCGMNAMGFSEHGNLFEWWHKKCAIEEADMMYIHAVEAYLTESLDVKVRDNYHCVLVARNYDGFLELNALVSRSFCRTDNHFYYTPRISFDELFSTSDNIIVTSACIGGVFGKGSKEAQDKFLNFMIENKHRCFLEIGHHQDAKQLEYNRKMLATSMSTGIPLIAGTDTHVLNETHEKGRSILQTSKDIHFDGEENWDLKFKTFDELVEAYRRQRVLPEDVFMKAIANTNKLASMVSEFEIDRGTKYPHIYNEPERIFREKIDEAIEKHPYALRNHTREELNKVVDEEFEVYKKTQSIDFMLLQTYIREWERENGIQCGYGRGSVSGSEIAYLLGITQMDSLRFGLNFFRFMNPSRVTNADIDTDYSGPDRDKVKRFLLKDKMNLPNIKSAEIITFNTIELRGAIRDICRALYKSRLDINYMEMADKIIKECEQDENSAREKYSEVFEYVDIVYGTIVSIGTHASGVLLSDLEIEKIVGLCSIKTSDYPVSMLNMKELDDLMFVKIDALGLANIGLINETCKTIGIPRLNPDNINLDDEEVWKDIRNDTTLIFQWESGSAQQYLRKFMSDKTLAIAKKNIPGFSMLKWMSFGNGLLRPACASFRDSVANGEFYDNGFDELNTFLAPEAGRIAMQETIMKFLVKFCGYSDAESDNVRRAIAKKKGTESLLPEIESRFIECASRDYSLTEEEADAIIKPFLQIILDASAYGFSWNHSDSYSCIGYISGYLRHYYPFEFITAALNIFNNNMKKTSSIIAYAKRRNINVMPPKWGISKGDYFFNKERGVIAKGLTSVKYFSKDLSDRIFEISTSKQYTMFVDILIDLISMTPIDTRQVEILVKIDFFSEYGNQRELLRICSLFYGLFKKGKAKMIRKERVDGSPIGDVIKKYSRGITKANQESKSYTIMDMMSILHEVETVVKSSGMQDLDDKTKIQNFYDALGYYGYYSGEDRDRRKLYVMDVYPLHRKKDGVQFGYSITTKSIGSGKESRFTVFNKVYKMEPIKKGDIILCKDYFREGKYFTLTSYDLEL